MPVRGKEVDCARHVRLSKKHFSVVRCSSMTICNQQSVRYQYGLDLAVALLLVMRERQVLPVPVFRVRIM